MRHVPDGIQQHEPAEAGAHKSEEDTERIHVQDESQRSVPLQQIEVERLAGMNQGHGSNHSQDSGQTGECCENPLGPGGTEPRNQELEHCTQQKRTRRNQNEVRSNHVWNASLPSVSKM